MKRSRYLLIPLLFLFLISLSNCAGTGLKKTGKNIEEKKVKRITPGVTTKEEIIDTFGKPVRVVEKKGESEELYYEYKEKETPVYLGGFLIYEKGAKEKVATLKVVIKDNTVESYHFKVKEEE